MRRLYFKFWTIALSVSFIITSAQAQMVADSVSMDGGYATDVYYSFSNGTVATADRTNWDIGFYTASFSAGIVTNDGKGIELYTYPNADTTGWNSIDTTGLYIWPVWYNSTESWEDGAFNRSANGHPDYGWGIYNMITHNLTGDSIYIMKFADDTYKKIWIVRKLSLQNIYYFRYANLDGSDMVEETLNCGDYTDKNFVYYSLLNQEVIDREPASDTWDILFTKYNEILEGGFPYLVTGVLANVDVAANRFDMVDPAFADWSDMPLDSVRNAIGYDWKTFDFTTGWMVYDSTVFFVKDLSGDVYKLAFTGFEGTSTGKIVFEKSLISPAGISDNFIDYGIQLYPNPASNVVSITAEKNTGLSVQISDISGKVVYRGSMTGENTSVNVSEFRPGIYIVALSDGQKSSVHKLVIR